jgi:3-oxoadipate enol-lactonase
MDTLLPGGDLVDELRTLRHPALVVRGDGDAVVSPELTRELVSLLPNARLAECADSGHTVAIEQPDWFAETVRAFLDG